MTPKEQQGGRNRNNFQETINQSEIVLATVHLQHTEIM